MSKRIVLVISVAMAILASDKSTAIAGDDRPRSPGRKQAVKPATLPKREDGQYWCAKRVACIKSGAPCRYQQNDIAF
jgi:hypothetical protein